MSLWTYAHSPRIAEEEDAFFTGHPLFDADRAFLDGRFTEPCRLIDLGCGAGRLSLHFARRGFDVTSAELSPEMLRVLGKRASQEGLDVCRVRANLCDLGCLPDRTFSAAISMFSTLGMIRGDEHRAKALRESFRILEPGGRLALHAHNIYLNLRDPQGRAWLRGQFWPYLSRRPDRGDRRMIYRGIPGMEVHLYRWRELKRQVKEAGFVIDEVLPIDAIDATEIRFPWLWHGLRAGGWIVMARRPQAS